MKPLIISHRANINGPDPKTENTIEAIKACQMYGIDVELDIWYKDGKYFLGHDKPSVEFDLLNFKGQQDRIWQGSDELRISAFFHAKDLETLSQLLELRLEIYDHDCFVHDKDLATLTYKNRIWTYPGQELHKLSIAVMPEYQGKVYRDNVKTLFLQEKIRGVCTDFPLEWLELQKEKDNVRR